MWVAGEVTEIQKRMEQVPLLPLLSYPPTPTPYSVTAQLGALPRPGEYLRLCPFTEQACQDKKMAQMKEKIKAPEKIQLSEEEIANLSDAQFKTLVIRMLTKSISIG